MSTQVAAHQIEGYRVNTPVYEGPLDLLLQLIERAELDITTLALAQVTEPYLAHVRQMQQADGNQNAAEVSGFLVIAARLVQMKSAALLPRPSLDVSVDDEDSGEALARQLIIYKRFKELAAQVSDRDAQGLRTYLRVAAPAVKVDARLDMSDVTISQLLQVARSIFLSQPDLPALSRVVSAPRVTIREKIRMILNGIRSLQTTRFSSFLRQRGDRLEAVVTFLAMLELMKRQVIEASQADLFGEIEIQSTGQWDDKEDGQLEFIE